MAVIKIKYIDNHLGVACSVFDNKTYESPCVKELIKLSLDDKFKTKYNYAIYTDDFQVPVNLFIPNFHLNYLNTEKKDIVILDEKLLEIPAVYDHHNYYTYDNEELLEKLEDKYHKLTFTNIKSLEEIKNVSTDE